MAITALTLSGAITAQQNQFGISSTSAVTPPVSTTGAGTTYLYVGTEMMLVTGVPVSGTVQVIRGIMGTQAQSAVSGAPLLAGGPSDFPNFTPSIGAFVVGENSFKAVGGSLTGATIAPTGPGIHHFTGTTALVTITVPAGLVSGGAITLVNDGSSSGLTWTAAGNISVAGTFTTAASAVTFFWDSSISKWVPSRLA